MGTAAGLFLILTFLPAAAAAPAAEQSDVSSRFERPIESLLLEKEAPILGIQWSGELFMDVPIGTEPPDSHRTIRRARLRFHRSLNQNWQLKLTADYNKGGKFEISDSYLLYAGWKAALLKIGVTSSPFSIEGVSEASGLTFMEVAMPVEALGERKSGGIKLLKRAPNSILNASLLFLNPDQDGPVRKRPGRATSTCRMAT